jgi:hypothetical protein
VNYVIPDAPGRAYHCPQVIAPIDEVFPTMNDTVKIERPLRCRRHEDLGGRTKQDSVGNAILIRTRANDRQNDLSTSWLSIPASGEHGPHG